MTISLLKKAMDLNGDIERYRKVINGMEKDKFVYISFEHNTVRGRIPDKLYLSEGLKGLILAYLKQELENLEKEMEEL